MFAGWGYIGLIARNENVVFVAARCKFLPISADPGLVEAPATYHAYVVFSIESGNDNCIFTIKKARLMPF